MFIIRNPALLAGVSLAAVVVTYLLSRGGSSTEWPTQISFGNLFLLDNVIITIFAIPLYAVDAAPM